MSLSVTVSFSIHLWDITAQRLRGSRELSSSPVREEVWSGSDSECVISVTPGPVSAQPHQLPINSERARPMKRLLTLPAPGFSSALCFITYYSYFTDGKLTIHRERRQHVLALKHWRFLCRSFVFYMLRKMCNIKACVFASWYTSRHLWFLVNFQN